MEKNILALVTLVLFLSSCVIQTAGKCTENVTFTVQSLNDVEGFTKKVEVFGIPMIASSKWNATMLNHVASVLAELIDNDNDGCADDPKALKYLLKKKNGKRNGVILPSSTSMKGLNLQSVLNAGIRPLNNANLEETKARCSGLKFTQTCCDASIEELFHFLTTGLAGAHPKIFGHKWTSNSKLTNAMDKARGGRRKKTPKNSKNYPPTAWYRYVDSHKPCKYKCQGVEYIWWGYCSFSGLCAGRSGSKKYENQFTLLKKSQLVKGDKPLTKLFTDSANCVTDCVYKLPTHYVDGTYTGCKTCSNGKNHGGA